MLRLYVPNNTYNYVYIYISAVIFLNSENCQGGVIFGTFLTGPLRMIQIYDSYSLLEIIIAISQDMIFLN